jgi:hypothetical protein
MDAWGWDELQPWLELRVEQWSSAGARTGEDDLPFSFPVRLR